MTTSSFPVQMARSSRTSDRNNHSKDFPQTGRPVAPGHYLYRRFEKDNNNYEGVRFLFRRGIKQPLLGDPKSNCRFGLFRSNLTERDVLLEYSRDPYQISAESRHMNSPVQISDMYGHSMSELYPEETERLALSMVRSYTCNFNKLKSYNWKRGDQIPSFPRDAADKVYIKKMEIEQEEDAKSVAGSDRSRPTSAQETIDCSQCKLCTKWRGLAPCTHKPKSQNNAKKQKTRRMDVSRLHPVVQFQTFRVHTPGSRRRENTDDSLFSQIRGSISQFKGTEATPIQYAGLERPLKTERGKYRPISRTIISTPNLAYSPCAQKEFKSANAYMDYMKVARDRERRKPASPIIGIQGQSKDLIRTNVLRVASYGQADSDTQCIESLLNCNRPYDGLLQNAGRDSPCEFSGPSEVSVLINDDHTEAGAPREDGSLDGRQDGYLSRPSSSCRKERERQWSASRLPPDGRRRSASSRRRGSARSGSGRSGSSRSATVTIPSSNPIHSDDTED